MRDADQKLKIINALKSFSEKKMTESSLNLFRILGYNTSRRMPLYEASYACFKSMFVVGDTRFDEKKAIAGDWKSVDLLFQLSAAELSSQITFFNTSRVDNTIMESYLFFAIELSGQTYTRTELSRITRELNKIFPMPVMILFKYDQSLTLSVINRRLNERDENKDVLKKVTLIKDINFENPHRAHIEVLCDLSFDELYRAYGFTNFVELHNAWQKTLDTKELNKKFYQELSNWYFWAINKVSFPDDAEKDWEIRNATGLIRLITRVIFIWFLKEKELVPDIIFNKLHLVKILKKFNSSRSDDSYYRAILQNLFFGTLNQRMDERHFAKEGSFAENRKEYGVKTLYRYADDFAISKDEAIAIFKDIPFLNGGLFDCLDKENDEGKVIYVDGFTRNEKKQAKIPDYLFFTEKEEEIDLNEIYGTKNKSYKARGLIAILSSYKFTVTENTPIEEEIALDPELLGRVFENLLASYNPETKITARKQTGSFYTHSSIVNFMVDESLTAYFCQKLDENGFKNKEPEIRDLLAYSENGNPFGRQETDLLIKAIDDCKIIDPACGSGAFPMGVLNKLVHVLHKLDPNNEKWKERQIEKAQNLDDPIFSENTIRDIEEAFQNNELDYGRKLFLIQNCIYGVDIQPIAVQITKLRFFISLIIDQKKRHDKPNCGIFELPNLELKFVAANSLFGLDKPKQIMMQNVEKGYEQQVSIGNTETERLEKSLKELRHRYFSARTRKEKLAYQKKDKEIRHKISKLLAANGWREEVARQVTAYDPFDQNISMSYFDPEYMYGLKENFDIVIGNPPYIRQELIKGIKPALARTYKVYNSTSDLYTYFYELTYNILRENGISTFITNNSWIKNKYGTKLRKFLLENTQMLYLINFEDEQNFEAAIVETNILIFKKAKPSDGSVIRFAKTITDDNQQYKFLPQSKQKPEGFVLEDSSILELKERIKQKGKELKDWDININYGIKSGLNEAFYISGEKRREMINQHKKSSEIIKPLLRGREIRRWVVEGEDNWLINPHNGLRSKGIKRIDVARDYPVIYSHLKQYKEKLEKRTDKGDHWTNLRNCAYLEDFEKEKIVWIVLSDRAKFAYDDEGYYTNDSTFIMTGNDLKYLLAVLNSKVSEWYFDFIAPTSGMGTTMWKKAYIEQIPIAETSDGNKKTVECLVDYIIFERKHNGESNAFVFFDDLLNSIVFELYFPEEIKKADCEILKRLQDLPDLKSIQDTDSKLSTVRKVYDNLSNPAHPVSIAMNKIKGVPEVMAIGS